MAWKDELRPGSFRGVSFLVESSDQKLGRRATQTEFPGRDEPMPEDMGRRAWGDQLQVFVLGVDHLQQAASLAAALNEYGPGELVHPYLGTMQVQVGEVSLSHSTREGGCSRFSIEVMEAGERKEPTLTQNTDLALSGSCQQAQETLNSDFLSTFSITELPQGLIDELAVRYDDAMGMLSPVRSAVRQGQSVVASVRAIAALLADPQALIDSVMADAYALFGLASPQRNKTLTQAQDPPSAERVQDLLLKLPKVEVTRITAANPTPSRQRQEATQSQLLDLIQGSLVIASGAASSRVVYRDREQAGDVQHAFLTALEHIELRASDALYQALQAVKVDMLADLAGRGAGLPSVKRILPRRAVPVLVQAYRIYQDATRSDELVLRNRLEHPLFIPADEWLEIVQ